MRSLRLFFIVVGCAACIDPVHSDAVDSLGPEVSGVRPGPNHRPGQPCLTCHGGQGPASPEWSMAGTVFAVQNQAPPGPGITVEMTDSKGSIKTAVTNQVGNFYVQKSEWEPQFPVRVRLLYQDKITVMQTRIGRSGSCADCHRKDGANNKAPAIFMSGQ